MTRPAGLDCARAGEKGIVPQGHEGAGKPYHFKVRGRGGGAGRDGSGAHTVWGKGLASHANGVYRKRKCRRPGVSGNMRPAGCMSIPAQTMNPMQKRREYRS